MNIHSTEARAACDWTLYFWHMSIKDLKLVYAFSVCYWDPPVTINDLSDPWISLSLQVDIWQFRHLWISRCTNASRAFCGSCWYRQYSTSCGQDSADVSGDRQSSLPILQTLLAAHFLRSRNGHKSIIRDLLDLVSQVDSSELSAVHMSDPEIWNTVFNLVTKPPSPAI